MVIEFEVSQLDDEPTRVDRDAVWSFLSGQAYWARWRTRQDLERQLDSAWRVVGVYEAAGDGQMVGFARAISDGVAFAYLADVYIAATARGQGLGSATHPWRAIIIWMILVVVCVDRRHRGPLRG